MIKIIIGTVLLYTIPLIVTYVIVSDLGKPQHHYHSPSSVIRSD